MNARRWGVVITLGLVAVVAAVAIFVIRIGADPPPTAGWSPNATVTIYGRDGTFGALGDTVPTGQRLVRQPVPGWSFPAGRQAYTSVVAADGSVLIAGLDQNASFVEQTSGEAVVAAYDPATNRYANIRLRTSTGRDLVLARDGTPAAPSVADLEPVAGGAAVAFTARPTYRGQDLEANGSWPVLGLLTKVDGRWQVAEGNQWTGAQLAVTSPALCPAVRGAAASSECGGLNDMASLPASRDLVVTQYDGGIAVLRVTGPDATGRFTVAVRGHYRYPRVDDPATPARDALQISAREVHADPTGVAGEERFTVGLDVRGAADAPKSQVLQEFRYDAATGAIEPVTAPFLPGDEVRPGRSWGFGAFVYDLAGNLWATRIADLSGGELAVYPERDCPPRMGFGRACPPDYDIVQPKEFPASGGLAVDPVNGDVVSVALGGFVMAIRATGSGPGMTFQIGNVVDLGPQLLPPGTGDFMFHRIGSVDASHRVWLTTMHAKLGSVNEAVDQWLYAVDVNDLFAPGPTTLPETAGQSVTVQAEQRATMTTSGRARGPTVDVVADAYVAPCGVWITSTDCGYDGEFGNGLLLRDSTGFGHLSGAVEYRLRVPTAGRYRLAYRVATFAATTEARIEATIGDRRFTTPVSTGGPWTTIRQNEPIELPAGLHTIRLAPPSGNGGWALNWFSLQRA